MRDQDPKVSSLLTAVKAPPLGAPLGIHPPDEAEDAEQEVAEFVARAWEWVQPRRTLAAVLTCLDFGFSLIETVYRRTPDGRLTWKGLYPCHQTTVRGWYVGQDEELAEVEFWAPREGVKWDTYRVEAQHLTHFGLNQEGNNFEGRALLRPAYTYWLAKRQAVRGMAIDVERAGSGFLKFTRTQPGTWSKQDEEHCAEAALNWRNNESAFMVLPYGADMEFEFPKIPVEDRVAWLRYLDQQIVATFMATFLELGLGPAGTQALSKDLRSNFLGALRSIADFVEDVFNSPGGPIQRLVDLNFGSQEQGRYPTLQIGRLADTDVDSALDSVTAGVGAGIFGVWRPEDANVVRGWRDLPPLLAEDGEDEEPAFPSPPGEGSSPGAGEADEDEEIETPSDTDAEGPPDTLALARTPVAQPGQGMQLPDRDADGVPLAIQRRLTEAESCVAYAAIEAVFTGSEETFEAAVKQQLDMAGRRMAQAVREVVYAEGVDAAAKVERITKLRVKTADRAQIQEAIREHLEGIADEADRLTRAEIGRQTTRPGLITPPPTGVSVPMPVDTLPVVDMADAVNAQAHLATERMVGEIESGIRDAGARGAVLGPEGAAQAIRDADVSVTERAEGFYRKHASQATGTVISQAREQAARQAFIEAGVKDVAFCQHSALLDEKTCAACAAADGTTYAYGSADYYRYRPPYQACAGRGRCRCLQVFVGAREEVQRA